LLTVSVFPDNYRVYCENLIHTITYAFCLFDSYCKNVFVWIYGLNSILTIRSSQHSNKTVSAVYMLRSLKLPNEVFFIYRQLFIFIKYKSMTVNALKRNFKCYVYFFDIRNKDENLPGKPFQTWFPWLKGCS
jgi:hypothetical protein